MDALKKRLAARTSLVLGFMATMLGATASWAIGIPSPPFCSVPAMVRIVDVGADGTPSPMGLYRVVVRDGFNNPIANAQVILQFLNCGAVRLASDGYPPGITVDCRPTHRTVRRITNAQGVADFLVPGTALVGGTNPPSCVTVIAEAITLANVAVSSADLSGDAGVGANDLSLWLQAFASGDASLADLDGDGSVSANDLSEWLEAYSSGLELATPGALCP